MNSSYEYYDGGNWVQVISTPAKVDLYTDGNNINMADPDDVANNGKITNLTAGTADGDAVNFRQMDDAVIPPGGIIMWSGTNLPAGWALCNGNWYNVNDNTDFAGTSSATHTVQTPDLTGQFILGASTVGTYGGGGAELHTTSNITYFEQTLYTTAPANCSPFQFRYSFTIECTISEPGVDDDVNTTDYNNIPASSCNSASAPYVGQMGAITECIRIGGCTQTNNPQYYIGNPACSTGATQRAVVTSTDNQPQFYRLAFIMKL